MTFKTQPSAVRCGVTITHRLTGPSYFPTHASKHSTDRPAAYHRGIGGANHPWGMLATTSWICRNVAIRVERWDGEWMPVCAECHDTENPSISVKAYQAKCAGAER